MVYLLPQWYRIEGFASAYDWLIAGLERCSPAVPHSRVITRVGPLDGFGDVEALGEPAAVQPCDAVSDLEPGVLDRTRQTMPRARPTEREDVPARLEDPQALGDPGGAPILESAHLYGAGVGEPSTIWA